MNKYLNAFFCFIISIITIMVLMWISTWNEMIISNVEFSSTPNEHKSIRLPFSENFTGSYTINLDLQIKDSTSQQFRITPDDELISIKLNGETVSLDNISKEERRNYSSGFLLTLDNLKPNQANQFEFLLANESNPTGFNIQTTQRCTKLQLIAIFCVLLSYALFLTSYLRISAAQKLFFIITLAISILYLSKTDERTRTFDVFEGGGHKDYIEYLIKNHTFPNPGEGWEYHQPPFYYLSAAIIKSAAQISNMSGYLWGQLLALFYWCVFLVSSLASLRLVFRRKTVPLLVASVALCLWPAGIIHSIRVGNDVPLYAFYGLTFYYTLKWWRSRQTSPLFWASFWMAASILTKSNGLAAAATLGILFCCHLYMVARTPSRLSLQKHKTIKDIAIVGGLFALALILNFGDNVYYYLNGTTHDWLLSNVGTTINQGLKVNNDVKNYFIFDLSTYLQHPFISTWDDQYGRQYFWNFLWRSSLSSEFFFYGNYMDFWGVANGILLLLAISSTFIYALQKQPAMTLTRFKYNIYKNLPWLFALIFPFIFLLAYRIKVPLSCNTDFRYIYPVLLSMLFFAVLVLREPKKFPIPAFLSISLLLISINTLLWIYFLK